MDSKAESETALSFSAVEDPALEQKLFLSSSHGQTESGAPILLQLLEFKTGLQDVVEELHIRRDAETRFEDEISKLALEKQELEWEKESLQHKIETMSKQHTDSLDSVKKRFQVKLQHTEEEKLLKYNLEKKSSELEQKLALQSRTKDSHLKQLAEVEKRFSALSKQCAIVKQAHDQLEQNVDEAMKINNKLTSAREKQEGIIDSLKKELEEVSNKLIKEKMNSVRHEKTQSPLWREQHIQELQQKVHMEFEMNKKLREENVAERAEKQKLMRALQHNQQLLLSQTQTVRRLEQELESQTQMFKALKQEREVMRENRKTMEDKVAELMESYAAAKTSWDKERETLLNQIKNEQSDIQALKEAHEGLELKCADLILQASSQVRQAGKPQMKDNSQSPLVATQLSPFSSVSERFRAEETAKGPDSSSQLPDLDSLQCAASSQPKIQDCLKDTGTASKLAATGANGGQDEMIHQQEMIKQSSYFTSSIPEDSENTTETAGTRDLIGLDQSLLSKSTCVGTSNPEFTLLNGSTELFEYGTYEKNKREKNKIHERGEDSKKVTNNTEQEEKVLQENVKSERNAAEKRATPVQMADSTDMHRDGEGSAKATERTSNPETRARGEREVTDGVKERGESAKHASESPETQIPALTTADMTEASLGGQVNDFMDTELPSTVCEPLNYTESVSLKTTEKDGNVNSEFTVSTNEHKVTSDEHSISAEDELHILTTTDQTSCPEAQSISLCQIPGDENPSRETSGAFPAECASQTNPAGELKQEHNMQVCQTNQTETGRRISPHVNADMIETDENTDAPVSSESELMREPPPEISAKESVRLTSAVANDEDDAQKRKQIRPNVNACETVHTPSSTSCLKDVSMEAILLPDVSRENIQEETKTNTPKDSGLKGIIQDKGDLNLSVRSSHDNNGCPDLDRSQLHQKRPGASSDLSLMSRKPCRSLFDWGAAQRKRPKSDGSGLLQLNQVPDVSRPDSTEHSPGTIPMYNEGRHNKAPLVILRASDLFSVSGATSSLTGQQREETCREEPAETDKTLSLSVSSFPLTLSSNTSSKGSLQTNLECSKAQSSAPVTGPESEWDLSCSQERETQQSAFRAQISKIEHFLNSERLRLSKRRRTDN
ncbi:PREDICTED: coiled-coil domain-containing protein 73 isoform X2 [Poecilia mexicana]|uniref:coiled-coil domain-containing protein 73 isoform X2 n=1 Tax=Poecilia mexicana TaxID=48701 RepID=UPI00072ED9C7|nr:PREDICTED: coiled-coil domain-containing protein 73 isoform X2 [Poecilia mexicana]